MDGMQGLLTEMTRAGQPPPEVSASAAASVISGQNGITQEHFAQICFAVYAQIVLDRVFDDLPLITRMFLVQRVRCMLVHAWVSAYCIQNEHTWKTLSCKKRTTRHLTSCLCVVHNSAVDLQIEHQQTAYSNLQMAYSICTNLNDCLRTCLKCSGNSSRVSEVMLCFCNPGPSFVGEE